MKQFLNTDEQIFIAHEIEIKLLLLQNTLIDLKKTIDSSTKKYRLDKNILASMGVVHDGIAYVSDCLNDTISDSCLSSYKTSDERFIESEDATFEREHKNNVRYIYNHNKM